MTNPKYSNFMTTVKQEFDEKNKRKYSNMKEQKNMTFYNLYKDKIITIQRWYRSCIARRVKLMEKTILQKMKRRHELLRLNSVKNEALQEISDKRAILMQQKQSEFIAYLERQIAQKIKRALGGTLNCAESLAEGNSKAKYVLGQLKQTQNRGEELQGQVEALKFEYNCHRKRKAEWQEKLFKIKQSILNETLKTKDIKTRINQIARNPLQIITTNKTHL